MCIRDRYKIDTRLKDYFREKWITSAKFSHEGLEYLEMALFNCETKQYLNFIMRNKSVNIMLKWRTSNHNLLVETQRCRNRKPYEERLCNMCNTRKIQDMYHVMVECPKFTEYRSRTMKSVVTLSRSELYAYLNNISIGELKANATFMNIIDETIRSE